MGRMMGRLGLSRRSPRASLGREGGHVPWEESNWRSYFWRSLIYVDCFHVDAAQRKDPLTMRNSTDIHRQGGLRDAIHGKHKLALCLF